MHERNASSTATIAPVLLFGTIWRRQKVSGITVYYENVLYFYGEKNP
jgi:hypothetical protein